MQLIPEFSGPGISLNGSACSRCNSIKRADDPGVISTGIFVEAAPYVPGATEGGPPVGAIELCVGCWIEGGALIGMTTGDKADELRKNNRALGLRVGALERRLEGNDVILRLIAEEKARAK